MAKPAKLNFFKTPALRFKAVPVHLDWSISCTVTSLASSYSTGAAKFVPKNRYNESALKNVDMKP
jgi:hypothetical protein